MTSPYNLLTEALFSVGLPEGAQSRLDLAQVLATLSSGTITSFTALRAHQAPAWHAFLVQLAALALDLADITAPPHDAPAWRALLRAFYPDGDEPWCLVVADAAKPAFMQPPSPGGRLQDYKRVIPTPDALDVLVTSKNHDLKLARMTHPQPEHWAFALVTLQTMEGFLGRGNYGIARMNGGFASRPFVASTPGDDLGARFRRDLIALQQEQQQVADTHDYNEVAGLRLLWLSPWDGQQTLTLPQCHPWFIEVCRRVRLVESGGTLRAQMAPTKSGRTTGAVNGITGDPWAPIDLKGDGKALTVGADGFSYKRLQRLIFSQDHQPAPVQNPRPEDGDSPLFQATVLVRGQGKTEGFFHRTVPIPPPITSFLVDEQKREQLGGVARTRVEMVGDMARKVLHPALCVLVQGAPDKLDFREDRTARFLHEFDQRIDHVFFPALWSDFERLAGDPHGLDKAWAQVLRQHASAVFEDAIGRIPQPRIRRLRVRVAAERTFHGSMRKKFPSLFQGADQDA